MKYIEEQTHINWLKKLKEENPSTIAFFIEDDGKYIGVTYFHSINREKKECDWGIYIYDEAIRGKGLGQKALLASIEYAKSVLKMNTIFLEVLEENFRAKALYEKIGFELFFQSNNVLRYQKIL